MSSYSTLFSGTMIEQKPYFSNFLKKVNFEEEENSIKKYF